MLIFEAFLKITDPLFFLSFKLQPQQNVKEILFVNLAELLKLQTKYITLYSSNWKCFNTPSLVGCVAQ